MGGGWISSRPPILGRRNGRGGDIPLLRVCAPPHSSEEKEAAAGAARAGEERVKPAHPPSPGGPREGPPQACHSLIRTPKQEPLSVGLISDGLGVRELSMLSRDADG